MSPFVWISESNQRALFLVLTVLLVVLSLALSAIGAPLVTGEAPWGILSFEFARSAGRAASILDSWSSEAREHAMLSLGLDYLYLVVYPAWFSLACVLIGRRHTGWFRRFGGALAWVVLAAGVLDALENYALIQMVAFGPGERWARLAAGCAGPKFGLVFVATVYVLAGCVGLIWQRLRRA